MASASMFSSLGALYDEHSDNVILNRLKSLAAEVLPDGWRLWQLLSSGDVPPLDPAVLNKIRFALPTEGIALAFDPAAKSLKERRFRDMKVKMLRWPFCRGLIFSPSSLSIRIRGSSLQHKSVIQCIASLRPYLLSREAADRLLSSQHPPQLRSSSASSSITAGEQSPVLDNLEERFVILEARAKRLEDSMAEIFNEIRRKPSSLFSDYEESLASTSSGDSNITQTSAGWTPSSVLQETIVVKHELPEVPFVFTPIIKERQPDIPEPSTETEATGHTCQRFNSKAWCNIPYQEAQKALHAAGSFAQLQVNPELLGPSSAFGDLLANTEGDFGTLCHGLLLQRQFLAEALNQVISRHPAAASDLRLCLSAEESPFRQSSDNLLQFVCGKRSELIAKRRKIVESSSNVHPRFLKDIPPAGGYLFEEKQLADVLRSQQGTSRAPQLRRIQHSRETLRKCQNSRLYDVRKRPTLFNDHPASKKKFSDNLKSMVAHEFTDQSQSEHYSTESVGPTMMDDHSVSHSAGLTLIGDQSRPQNDVLTMKDDQ